MLGLRSLRSLRPRRKNQYWVGNLVSTWNSDSEKPMANSSPAKIKRLFGLKKSSKKKPTSSDTKVSAVIIDLEDTNPTDLGNIDESAFYYLPPQEYTTKSRLLRSINFIGALPALIILDTSDLRVTTSQGRRVLCDDPKGTSFPWTDPPTSESFKSKFLRNRKNADGTYGLETIDSSSIDAEVKGIYFGAKWCPPCRVITKQLCSIYEKIKSSHPSFEIFFCSSDRSEESFKEHFATMPWLAFPFDGEILNRLTRTYDVNGIPTFIIVDEQNNLITRHGRNILLGDPTGAQFPWPRLPIYELTEFTVHRIADMPSLILFTEGCPGDNEFSMQILKPCADLLFTQLPKSASMSSTGGPPKEGQITSDTNSGIAEDHSSIGSERSIPSMADPLQVFYTGEDPICDYILESIGQGQADLPLLVICDVIAGHIAICDKPDVSENIIFEFVADYREGKANVIPLPSITCDSRKVGGIPVNLLEQIISNQGNTMPSS
ncbi:thioredoxin-like domain-containing protein [Ditylenchus destructor]|uniref:Thioredoxin-like domain-containing protein n=1 Tax=Ditylenchus destructor TaxID=166010 RepID=A0AAD4RB48_9BILA|nr:thioredoxin-like domain-containing protein [Ditylenchus destructor]